MTGKKITRKDFLKTGGAGLGALLLQTALPGNGARGAGDRAPGERDRPNILFITMDQLRSLADIPERLPLPSLRKLQRASRTFSNYCVHQAPCGPSRATFYTGQHIQKTGMYTNPTGEFGEYSPEAPRTVELRAGFPTLGTMLREQGYYTAYKGKWHLSVINQKIGTDKFPNATQALEPYGPITTSMASTLGSPGPASGTMASRPPSPSSCSSALPPAARGAGAGFSPSTGQSP